MKKAVIYTLIISTSAMAGISGCARNISSNNYKASHVGEASETFQGSVISSRVVDVKEGERLQDNGTGLATGALAGGVGGSMIGSGSGSLAAAAGGAIIGGVLGALAEGKLSEQQGMEYIVKLTNGEIKTVVQGLDNPLAVGDKVFLMVSNDGRSRIVRDTTGTKQGVQKSSTKTTVVKLK